jgi:hypothetical protein
MAHVIHGKKDRCGTATAVREGAEIGEVKIANHREVTRTSVQRTHDHDVT